jgi:cysteine-rich repeat protein
VKLSLVLSSITLAGLIACSSEDPNGDGQNLVTCVKNQTSICYCPLTLDEGTRTCTEDGQLSECRCPRTKTEPKPTPTKPPTTAGADLPTEPTDTCGDGTIDQGEACDDGNKDDGDGCSAKCLPDGAPDAADTCPGQPVTLWKGTRLALAGTTEPFTPNLPASCYTSLGPDRVYAVHPTQDGVMTVEGTFAPGFNAVVEIRADACEAASNNILCEDTISRPFERVVQVQAGHTYFVVIGGDVASNAGAYTLHIELP